jgi:hypothetical protein
MTRTADLTLPRRPAMSMVTYQCPGLSTSSLTGERSMSPPKYRCCRPLLKFKKFELSMSLTLAALSRSDTSTTSPADNSPRS